MRRSYPTTRMCSGELLSRFEPTVRDSDVFTATIAKCGQTWLCALLHHLRTRGEDPEYGDGGILEAVPWLERPVESVSGEPFEIEARLAQLEALPSPRVFKMHVIWQEVPRPPGSRAPIITITRDPRDVPYSMYQHLLRLREKPLGDPPPPFDVYFESWLDNDYYGRFIASFWPHRNDPDVLWLRYEDMKADTAREARRIVEALGWERSDEEIAKAIELASFDKLREQEAEGVLEMSRAFDEPFFREGGVGKNREHLSATMEARIVDRIRSTFSEECASFLLAQG